MPEISGQGEYHLGRMGRTAFLPVEGEISTGEPERQAPRVGARTARISIAPAPDAAGDNRFLPALDANAVAPLEARMLRELVDFRLGGRNDARRGLLHAHVANA